VRIYSGRRDCEKGERCEKLAVITCEFMPQPELIKELSTTSWAGARRWG
jgi:hypothetical protein